MTTSDQIMLAIGLGSVCAVLAGIAVAVLARHERRQRETWRDDVNGFSVFDDIE